MTLHFHLKYTGQVYGGDLVKSNERQCFINKFKTNGVIKLNLKKGLNIYFSVIKRIRLSTFHVNIC